MSTGLHIENLRIMQGKTPLLHLTAQIAPGEVLTIMGPSGSGKSTLLAALIGALPAGFSASGDIHLNGQTITHLPTQSRQIGLLFQDDILFPHLSVAGNLAFGLPSGGTKHERAVRIDQALTQIDMAGFGPRDPATLSGGQRARVALMRTLLAEPKALLLDEPFSRLDHALRDQVRRLVFAQSRRRTLPVILVTHDPADARAAGGRVIDTMGNPQTLA